jgi:hypothetical protein
VHVFLSDRGTPEGKLILGCEEGKALEVDLVLSRGKKWGKGFATFDPKSDVKFERIVLWSNLVRKVSVLFLRI